MSLCQNLASLRASDTALAGGKGASLGEMIQAGIPVPPGFVVLSSAFERFLSERDLGLAIDTAIANVNTSDMSTVERAAATIQNLIARTDVPEYLQVEILSQFDALGSEFVAVRSSATAEDSNQAAWAGQLDSFLNTSRATLLHNVRNCWASLFTPRAIFYRIEKNLHQTKISVAVVIQKMVESEVSGIAFSVHPVTQNYNQLIIEAGYGLGEAIVSGQITPDSYVVDKHPLRIIDTTSNTQSRALHRKEGGGNEWQPISEPRASAQVLPEAQILELAAIIVRIETQYGFPCDIEWAYEAGHFYIVQSRPITTLSVKETTHRNTLGTLDNWQKLFRVQGLRYLIDDVWMDHYKNLDALSIVIDDEYTSYLPRTVLEQTLNEGVVLLSSRELFHVFKEEFLAFIEKLNAYTATLNYEEITQQQVVDLLDLMARFFYFYAKTEFFATDRAYQRYAETNDPILAENIEKMGRIKNDSREIMNATFFGATATYGKLLAELAKRFGISVADLQQYSRSEIAALFDGGQVSVEVLNARRVAFYMQGVEGSLVVKVGQGARLEIEAFRNEQNDHQGDFLKGICGQSGRVRGRAFVIRMGYDNFDQLLTIIEGMHTGDILIAETTSPEYMPACAKAAAIVTDQGGLLSHAAIVSRELKIPCLLGTTTATDFFKTGDLVEVDADKGVVRKL